VKQLDFNPQTTIACNMRGQNSNDEGWAKDLQIVDSVAGWEAVRLHVQRSFLRAPAPPPSQQARRWAYEFRRPPGGAAITEHLADSFAIVIADAETIFHRMASGSDW
jgi:hypothetical protein